MSEGIRCLAHRRHDYGHVQLATQRTKWCKLGPPRTANQRILIPHRCEFLSRFSSDSEARVHFPRGILCIDTTSRRIAP